MNNEHKVYVVGRHQTDLSITPGLESGEIAGHENITWPHRVTTELYELLKRASNTSADTVLFQAVPAQLAEALIKERVLDGAAGWPHNIKKVGAVVNEPRPDLRAAPTERSYEFASREQAAIAAEAVKAANPRAKVAVNDNIVLITVDAPMPFKPVRVAWF